MDPEMGAVVCGHSANRLVKNSVQHDCKPMSKDQSLASAEMAVTMGLVRLQTFGQYEFTNGTVALNYTSPV